MTVATAATQTIDQDILIDIQATFDGFRSRIATMAVEATSALTAMYVPLGPVVDLDTDTHIIDIDAIEWEQFEDTVVSAHNAAILELSAA